MPRLCEWIAIVLTSLGLSVLSLSVPAVFAQSAIAEPQPSAVEAVRKLPATLVIRPLEITAGWLELTPLATEQPAILIRLGNRKIDDGEEILAPALPPGPFMLCSGGHPWAVLCEEVYAGPALVPDPAATAEIEVRFETGLEVTGRYRLDRWPVAGARVAVVPAELGGERPYILPLYRRGGDLVREVSTDKEGAFRVPALAAGEYFLETVLPSGRVHRGEPFTLPGPKAARGDLEVGDETRVSWNLGDIDVADGLTVEIRVRDPEERPIRGARIAARQGDDALTLVSFQGVTGASGNLRMSGFSVEEPVHLSCTASGYAAFRQEYELVPVIVLCDLEPLAAAAGVVVGSDGLPVDATVVSVRSAADESQAPVVTFADATGLFVVADLVAGEYRLTAAASGSGATEQSFTVAPGDRLDLGTIVLRPGSTIEGLVVDAETREPIPGAKIQVVDPPGAGWAVADGKGVFTVVTRGAGSSARPFELEVTAAGYAAAGVELSAQRIEDDEPLIVELQQAGWIRALVWRDGTGRPCQGCRLAIWPSAEELLTDSAGEALSGPLAAGHYRVYRPRVSHLGSTVIERPDAESVYARVEPGEITTVRFGDRPDTARITFRPLSDRGWSLSARTPWRIEKAPRQADGSFHVRRRPGESLELYLHFFDRQADAESEIWQATLPPYLESGELVLPRRRATVSGRATSLDRPIAGERVLLRSFDSVIRAIVHTRPDGSFVVPFLPPGGYAVTIGAITVKLISVSDGRSLDLGTFELIPGGY